ncbi:MAG: phosphotransferase [Bacillota bacterium]|nr:MAG: phosphotransferase [Bacillota bacterium]
MLPGVDDGPTSWSESVEMVRMAAADGIAAIAATSHMMPDGAFANRRTTLLPLVSELQERLRRQGVDVAVYPGGEVYMSPDVIARLERKEVLTYNDAGRYILLELPATEVPSYARRVIEDLVDMGIRPIIAHPERNAEISHKPQIARQLVDAGALLQVNAGSLRWRHATRQAAKYLLTRGYVHFLATDCHGVYTRRPRLSPYVAIIAEWIGADAVRKLVRDNPAAVLAGRWLDPPEIKEKPGLGARLFGALRGARQERGRVNVEYAVGVPPSAP